MLSLFDYDVFKLCTKHVRSILNQIPAFRSFYALGPGIALIAKTCLHGSVLDCEIGNYGENLVRHDNSLIARGRVFIYIKSSFIFFTETFDSLPS